MWPDWVHKVTTQHFGNHTEAKLNLGMFAYIENMEIRQGVCMCITDVSILRNRQLLHPNENMVLRKLTPKNIFKDMVSISISSNIHISLNFLLSD